MYCRMMIAECLSEDQISEFTRLFREVEPLLKEIAGFMRAELLIEESGRMVVVQMFFDTREHCLAYHSSRSYRHLVAKTQHLLIGDFVVKLFRME